MPTTLIDFMIGTNTAGLNDPNPVDPNAPVPAPAMTEVEWYRNMWTSGLIGYLRQKSSGEVVQAKPPGYTAPPPVMFSVPNIFNGDGTGTSQYPGVESSLQRKTAELVGIAPVSGLTKQQVALLLSMAATDAAVWLHGQDPDANNIPALVAKYIAVYTTAVTPV